MSWLQGLEILDVSELLVVSFQSEVCEVIGKRHCVSRSCEQIQRQVEVDSKQRVSQMSKVVSIVQSRCSCILSVYQCKDERLWKDFVEFQVPCTFPLQTQK